MFCDSISLGDFATLKLCDHSGRNLMKSMGIPQSVKTGKHCSSLLVLVFWQWFIFYPTTYCQSIFLSPDLFVGF